MPAEAAGHALNGCEALVKRLRLLDEPGLAAILMVVGLPTTALGSLHEHTEAHKPIRVPNNVVVAGKLVHAVNFSQPYTKPV